MTELGTPLNEQGFKKKLSMEIDAPFPQSGATAEDWRKALSTVVPAVVVLRTTATRAFDTEAAGASYATGFIVDKNRGIILTNRHVVKPEHRSAISFSSCVEAMHVFDCCHIFVAMRWDVQYSWLSSILDDENVEFALLRLKGIAFDFWQNCKEGNGGLFKSCVGVKIDFEKSYWTKLELDINKAIGSTTNLCTCHLNMVTYGTTSGWQAKGQTVRM
eukprot:Gb_35733 [translate_table: standard]